LVGALAEISIPPGEVIDQRYGGQEAFRLVMEKVHQVPLTGYLHSSLALEGHDSSGVIIFEAGRPIYAIYSFRPSGNESVEIIYRGERAMEFVCGDSLYANSLIEVHRVKDLKELEMALRGRDVSRDFSRSLDNFYKARVAEAKDGVKSTRVEQNHQIGDADQLSAAILDFHMKNAKEKKLPRRTLEINVELTEGESYLVEELSREYSHGVFAYLVEQGMTGLGITRSNPKILRSRVERGKPQILWLTDHETRSEQTVPPSLEKIMVVIEEFLATNERSVILLDDLQYMISSNNFDGAVRFIRSLVDKVSERKSIFLLSVDPNSMNPQEKSIVEREMTALQSR
jgi:hypothetical protein